jgi:hypothetical protein
MHRNLVFTKGIFVFQVQEPGAIKNKNVQCERCGKVMLPTSLPRHRRKHLGLEPHKCVICNKRFARRDNAKDHVTGVHYEFNWGQFITTDQKDSLGFEDGRRRPKRSVNKIQCKNIEETSGHEYPKLQHNPFHSLVLVGEPV